MTCVRARPHRQQQAVRRHCHRDVRQRARGEARHGVRLAEGDARPRRTGELPMSIRVNRSSAASAGRFANTCPNSGHHRPAGRASSMRIDPEARAARARASAPATPVLSGRRAGSRRAGRRTRAVAPRPASARGASGRCTANKAVGARQFFFFLAANQVMLSTKSGRASSSSRSGVS